MTPPAMVLDQYFGEAPHPVAPEGAAYAIQLRFPIWWLEDGWSCFWMVKPDCPHLAINNRFRVITNVI